MEEKRFGCTLITPLFSFGANQSRSELRTAELKGAMRYLYRIACPAVTKTLAKDEDELFGAAAVSGNMGKHASPIRLLIRGNMKSEKRDLLLHRISKPEIFRQRNSKREIFHQRNSKPEILSCFPQGHFEIIACLNQAVLREESVLRQKVNFEWYEDLIKLSLILCGMGRRSRKGRGCIEVEDVKFENKQKMQECICETLNKIASASSQKIVAAYKIDNEKIISPIICPDDRPVIQEIVTGRKIDKNKIDGFLLAVDKACHDLKEDKSYSLPEITGNIKFQEKFASPLIIRIVKTEEGYYPLYILIKGVYNAKIIDLDCSEREIFIGKLETMYRNGVGR